MGNTFRKILKVYFLTLDLNLGSPMNAFSVLGRHAVLFVKVGYCSSLFLIK